jgi:hypothetical protein
MDKLFTHYYKITLREDGYWCFRGSWHKKTYEQVVDDHKSTLLVVWVCLLVSIVL